MYILEGNIGAGKSTFLRLLDQKIPKIKTVLELMNGWRDTIYGQSLLHDFYNDPGRWAYTFELLTMIYRAQDHIRKQQDKKQPITFIERSIYSGFYCFAYNSYAQGFLNDMEWHSYKQWFSLLIPNRCEPPRGFIYLRISPDIAYERLKKRSRIDEKPISLAYLKQLHKCHEMFLIRKIGILPYLKRIPLLVINGNAEFETNSSQLYRHVDTVQSFLKQTGAGHTLYTPHHSVLL